MKQLLSLILVISLLVCLYGCRQEPEAPKGTLFYYRVKEPSYNTDSTALSAEYRPDAVQDTLNRAIELYLAGPVSPDLRSPFPENLRLIGVDQKGGTVYLTFSRELAQLSGLDLTIVCGCITMTVLELTDAAQAEIRSVTGLLDGQRSILMDKNSLLLLDAAQEEE